MSPMHLTGVRDGDFEHADDRGPSRQKRTFVEADAKPDIHVIRGY
jgi:hypothetical protein